MFLIVFTSIYIVANSIFYHRDSMQALDRVPLNSVQSSNAWQIYRSHATVGCCTHVIRNCVLGGGVLMPSVPSFLHAHFERLARSALDWTITIGVIPIVLMPHVIDGQLVPVVPQPEMINLFVGSFYLFIHF